MSASSVGIIGGGQLGSMLSVAAKKLNIKTSIYSDDPIAPASNFSDLFFYGSYEDEEKIKQFLQSFINSFISLRRWVRARCIQVFTALRLASRLKAISS